LNAADIKQYVQNNPKLVTMRESERYPGLYVLKYKKSVFYNNSWDDYLEKCRGSIVDKDCNLVSYPFDKIYNYGIEEKAPVLSGDTAVTAFRKVNGFMAAVTVHNGKLLVSTTGSTDSDFVGYALEIMAKHSPLPDWEAVLGSKDCQDMTFMFEVVHPADPHIIPEKSGMYLLGYRKKEWDSKVEHCPAVLADLADMLRCYTPEVIYTSVVELQALAKAARSEGYVAYAADGIAFKIKSPYYLVNKWVARNPRTDKLADLKRDIKRNIDEEYHKLIDYIRENLIEYTAMDEQARLAWVRNYL
jgi:hypothetical protein